jgi:hypothetical protein
VTQGGVVGLCGLPSETGQRRISVRKNSPCVAMRTQQGFSSKASGRRVHAARTIQVQPAETRNQRAESICTPNSFNVIRRAGTSAASPAPAAGRRSTGPPSPARIDRPRFGQVSSIIARPPEPFLAIDRGRAAQENAASCCIPRGTANEPHLPQLSVSDRACPRRHRGGAALPGVRLDRTAPTGPWVAAEGVRREGPVAIG